MIKKLLAVVGTAIISCVTIGAATPAGATGFFDDFEGGTPAVPVAALRNWNIIRSVDLLADSPSLCHNTGTCLDLIGTSGVNTGGIETKQSFAPHIHTVGFQLYGSNREGTIDRVSVYFGDRLIYANNRIRSDFSRFISIGNVRGPGKLKFIGIGQVIGVGPLVDNVVVLPR